MVRQSFLFRLDHVQTKILTTKSQSRAWAIPSLKKNYFEKLLKKVDVFEVQLNGFVHSQIEVVILKLTFTFYNKHFCLSILNVFLSEFFKHQMNNLKIFLPTKRNQIFVMNKSKSIFGRRIFSIEKEFERKVFFFISFFLGVYPSQRTRVSGSSCRGP